MALFVAVVARQAARPLTDPDTFWHLRLGHDIIDAGSVSRAIEWSPFADQAWVPTQWLPEVLAAKVEDWFGLAGVAWLFGLALVSLVLMTHRLCRREAGLVAATFTTGLAVVGMSASLSPRPHMVTYILLTVTLGAWLRTTQDLRPRWWLVPLTWVWACSHGMWFTGVVLGGAVVVGLAFDGRTSSWRQLLRLLSVPILSVIAAGLTPLGPKLLAAPFAVGGVSEYVTEWQAPSFRDIGPAATMLMIAVVAIGWSRAQRRASWSHVAILLLATGWTLLSVRTVTLGAILVAPLAAAVVQRVLQPRPEKVDRAERRSLLVIAVACLAWLAIVLPAQASEPVGVPTGLDEELEALPSGAVILNEYTVGGWLHWRHPGLSPVVDGLTEAYSPEHLSAYGRMTTVSRGWEDVVRDVDARYALLSEQSPLATALEERLSWQKVDADVGYVLLKASERQR